ncbi:MAG TPA: alkaline phosphatase D family protein [Nitrospira sp.]|nr:alkaline phosphatase D family protein [Nitrospira sp.]
MATSDLEPDTEYTLTLTDEADSASARTLPVAGDLKPLSIAVGSCYGRSRGKEIDAWLQLKDSFNEPNDPLRFRILCGDQIYLDLDPDDDGTIKIFTPPVWKRYLEQWLDQPFRDFLTASPNIMMADDHEFWNNYPVRNRGWNFWGDRELGGETGQRFDRAFSLFQAALNLDAGRLVDDSSEANRAAVDRQLRDSVRTFEMDFGFMKLLILDVRTRRTSSTFNGGNGRLAAPRFDGLPNVRWLEDTIRSLKALTVPAVLVLSQPLVEEPGASAPWEENLPEYPDDYALLWDAVFAAQSNILVVSGDIHWTRLYCVTNSSQPDEEVYEFIASPLSRIRSFAGTADPTLPDRSQGSVKWEGREGRGLAQWKRWPPGYVRDDENVYATLTFTPEGSSAGVMIHVDAWLWPLERPSLKPVRHKRFLLKGRQQRGN